MADKGDSIVVNTANSSESKLLVFIVPVLPSEGWTSIDLYRQDLDHAFVALSDRLETTVILPNSNKKSSWFRRQFDFYWRFPLMLCRVLAKRDKPFSVHMLDQNYGYLCRFVDHSVVTCHDLAPLMLPLLSPYQRFLYQIRVSGMKRASAIVCVSKHTAKDLSRLLGIDSRRIFICYNGVDPVFRPLAAPLALRGDLELELAGHFKILHVGSNATRKNLPVLLRALARLRRNVPGAVLMKIGNPLKSSPYAELISALGLESAVIDLGTVSVDRLVEYYNFADVMAFPSLYEGFGRPVIEAQACGTPCVLADSSALPEIGGAAALYHKAEDDEELAVALERLATDAGLYRSLSEAGLANARRFTWANHVERLFEIYRTVAQGNL